MAGGFRPGSESADLSSGGAYRQPMRLPTMPAPEASFLQRLLTPAPWEGQANAWLQDVLRRASTPAKWEQKANETLMRLLRGG